MTQLLVSVLAALLMQPGSPARAVTPRTPVLVELFTSEGCSSCPAADVLLANLLHNQPVTAAEIVPLEFHVDYWDRQGWKDPFSSATATKRQQEYARVFNTEDVYTPQMIVDGRDQFVGSDERQATHAINEALTRPHLPVRVTPRVKGDTLRLSIDLPPKPPDSEPLDVMVALTEGDLKSEVRRGENGGRTLFHAAVVRKHAVTGPLQKEASVSEGQWHLERGWNPASMRAVVWLQGQRTRRVYGCASAALQ